MKQKKDRIFIIVMAIIVANLFYILIKVLPFLFTETGRTDLQGWALALANIIGIVGAFWLIREERKRRRIDLAKRQEEQERKEI